MGKIRELAADIKAYNEGYNKLREEFEDKVNALADDHPAAIKFGLWVVFIFGILPMIVGLVCYVIGEYQERRLVEEAHKKADEIGDEMDRRWQER